MPGQSARPCRPPGWLMCCCRVGSQPPVLHWLWSWTAHRELHIASALLHSTADETADVTFNLKDFRVMLGLCEALQTNIKLRQGGSVPGRGATRSPAHTALYTRRGAPPAG